MFVSQIRIKLYSCTRQPIRALDKGLHRELICIAVRESGLIPGPFDPLGHVSSRPSILILRVEDGTCRFHISDPTHPPHRIQERPNLRLHDDGGGEIFPWPTKVCGSCEIVPQRSDRRFLNYNSSVLVRVFLPLSCDGVELVW